MNRLARLPVAWIVHLGIVLHLPSLGIGFYVDDYLHQLVLRGEAPMHPLALYDFGELADWTDREGDVGSFPWWSTPDWKARFFRPLSSATIWLDHALFGDFALGYQLVSLGWYALLLVLTHALYRALGMGAGTARAGLALFAVAGSSVLPVGWTANRNALLETVFTVAALWLLTQHARFGRSRAVLAAIACALCSCLSKESGVTALLMIAIFSLRPGRTEERDRPGRGTAVFALVPAVVFMAFLFLAGYGTRSLFYATPWSDPARFVENAFALYAIAPLHLLSPFPTDVVTMMPHITTAVIVVSLVTAVPASAWIWHRVKNHENAAFLGLWLLVTLLPQATAPLSDRLFLTPAVASSALLAMYLARCLPHDARPRRTGGERLFAAGLVASAGVASGFLVLMQGFTLSEMSRDIRRSVLAADVGSPDLGLRQVIVLQANNALVPFSMASTWVAETEDDDLRIWLVQTGRRGLEWTRVDETTFDLVSLDEPFLTNPFERVYMTDAHDEVESWSTRLFTVERLLVDDEGLRSVRMRFREPPDGPRFRFLVDEEGRLVATPPPAVGETRVLEAVVPPHPFVP